MPTVRDRAWGTRLLLLGVTLLLALGTGAGVLVVVLYEAERGLVAALEGKAKAHARIVRGDVELAIHLGIPLDELPGTYEYLEEGAEADPDIRFVAITDPDLVRLHYGGIGRARLDPLLASAAVQEAARNSAREPDQPLRALTVGDFSITLAPLFDDRRHAGFIVVAVQGREVQEALMEHLPPLAPLLLGILVLLVELVLWTTARALEEPWQHLRSMMAGLVRGDRLVWSKRHDRSELGRAARHVNGIFHRLRDRAERVRARASEVERAVFDREVARRVREQAAGLEAPPLGALLQPPYQPPDRRPSDVQPALVLLLAAVAAALTPLTLAPLAAAGGWPWAAPLGGAAAGLGLALVVRRPGWLLVTAGVLIAGAAAAGPGLQGWRPAVPAAAGMATLAAAWLHLRHCPDQRLPLWLATHAAAGLLAGALMASSLVLVQRQAVLPWLELLLVALAVIASNRAPVVRRQLFARGGRGAVAAMVRRP